MTLVKYLLATLCLWNALVFCYFDDRSDGGCRAYMEKCQPNHHRCCPGLHCVYQRCYWSGYRSDLREYTLKYMEAERRKMAAKMYAEQMARQFNQSDYPSHGNDPYAKKKKDDEREDKTREGFVYLQDARDPRVLQAAPLPLDYPANVRNPNYYDDRRNDVKDRNQWSDKDWNDRSVVNAPWYYPNGRPSHVKMILRGQTPPPKYFTDAPSIPLSAW